MCLHIHPLLCEMTGYGYRAEAILREICNLFLLLVTFRILFLSWVFRNFMTMSLDVDLFVLFAWWALFIWKPMYFKFDVCVRVCVISSIHFSPSFSLFFFWSVCCLDTRSTGLFFSETPSHKQKPKKPKKQNFCVSHGLSNEDFYYVSSRGRWFQSWLIQ